MEKRPFDIDSMLATVRSAVRPFPKAAMFELAERGFNTPFQQLVGCIISVRTLDEVSLEEALRLLRVAATPAAMLDLSVSHIDRLIARSTFHEAKAGQIRELAHRVQEEFAGELPCDYETLIGFKGVGPKCANLMLGIACQQPRISVDIHVHRVCNRWGYVHSATPDHTLAQLERKLPQEYRVEINALLVPFGKHICTGSLPKCSTCPVLCFCRQVGVTKHR